MNKIGTFHSQNAKGLNVRRIQPLKGHVHKLVVKIGIFWSMLVILPLGDN